MLGKFTNSGRWHGRSHWTVREFNKLFDYGGSAEREIVGGHSRKGSKRIVTLHNLEVYSSANTDYTQSSTDASWHGYWDMANDPE